MLGLVRTGMLLACCSIALPGTAFAATQGTIGATSQGSVSISATIPARAQISGLTDVVVQGGDGTLGLPEHAPYDRILVSAGAVAIPEPLLAQLAEGGRLVMPVGGADSQILVTCERDDKGTLHYRAGASCIFVPLISDSSPPPPL